VILGNLPTLLRARVRATLRAVLAGNFVRTIESAVHFAVVGATIANVTTEIARVPTTIANVGAKVATILLHVFELGLRAGRIAGLHVLTQLAAIPSEVAAILTDVTRVAPDVAAILSDVARVPHGVAPLLPRVLRARGRCSGGDDEHRSCHHQRESLHRLLLVLRRSNRKFVCARSRTHQRCQA
jgi:hypothetical protein